MGAEEHIHEPNDDVRFSLSALLISVASIAIVLATLRYSIPIAIILAGIHFVSWIGVAGRANPHD